MEIYFEQNVISQKLDINQGKIRTMGIVKNIIIGALIIFAVIAVMFFPLNSVGSVIFTLILDLGIASPFVLLVFFMSRKITSTSQEFDYYIYGDIFRIIKVQNRSKRKKLLEFSLTQIESVGKVSSENCDRYMNTPNIKKKYAVCNFEDEENLYYIYCTLNGDKTIIIWEPNQDMLISLRKAVPRMSVFEKSESPDDKPKKKIPVGF